MLLKLQKLNNILEKILLICGIISFVGLICVVILQIITRLWLPFPISWTEEISRFLFLYIVAFVAPVVLKNRELVFVDMFVTIFPTWFQIALSIAIDALIAVLSIVMFWTSRTYVLLGVGQIAPVTALPMYIPYASMALLGLFLALFSTTNLISRIADLKNGGSKI